jgi:broad-specificity NMP kinase
MERYVSRGCEDTVIEALNEHGLACILGLPGIGKTTTARYVALKLRENGLIPLILTSGDAEITPKDKVVEFADEDGITHTILQIPTSAYLTIDANLAKGIASAIAEVVNTSLKEKTLSQISKVVTKTEWGREVAKAIKNIGEKLNIRVPTETIKSSVEEVSKFVDLREVLEYSAEFCSCFLLSVDVIRLAEKFKGKDKRLKLEKEIVVIIDDVAEFKLSETVALQTLIEWLRKNGAGVLLVKRINFEKEFIEMSKETSDSYAGYANEIFAGSRDASGFF